MIDATLSIRFTSIISILLKDLSDCTGKDIDYYETKLLNTNKSYIVLEKKTKKNCRNLTRKYPEILKIDMEFNLSFRALNGITT